MSISIKDKKIFLIVSASEEKLKWLQDVVNRHISKPTIFTAADGITAVSKAENAPPHVLITDVDLPKITGLQVVDHILKSKETEMTAVILTGPPPKEESHLDELVTGKIQYYSAENNEAEFNSCLVRALNFSSHVEKAEFFLRFLAKGDVLLKEGEKADFVYFVKKGQLRAFRIVDGAETLLGMVEYGEFVGEMAYINGEPRSAHVSAETDCELIEVPIDTFAKVLFQRPSWSKALMVTLSKRVKQANEKRSPTRK